MLGRDRAVDRRLELVLDLPIALAAERHRGAVAGADDAGHHRHVVADHVVEQQRGLGLVHQGRDVPDVHRLVQVDKFAILPQAIEKLAEILLHHWAPRRGRGGAGIGPNPAGLGHADFSLAVGDGVRDFRSCYILRKRAAGQLE